MKNFKQQIISWYCIIFYVLLLYKLYNGMLLFQLRPSFFYTRQDVVTWLFMQTGLHQWLLNNEVACIIADSLFYMAPLLYWLCFKYAKKIAVAVAIVMLIINWCYVQCYTLYPSNSIEGHLAWLLFPVVFIPNSPRTFSLLFQGLRYFFLYFFLSAGIWKIVQEGVFNPLQMSGILLYQHSQLLTNSPEYWQTHMYLWLIRHTAISYTLYLISFLLEMSFITGFFTKKFDKWLAGIFILFLLMDHLIMRIPYYEVTPLLLTLLMKEKKTRVVY